jgi:hypothetical protein
VTLFVLSLLRKMNPRLEAAVLSRLRPQETTLQWNLPAASAIYLFEGNQSGGVNG